MKESIKNFIELVKEEADQTLAAEWEKVESERAEMQEEYRKVKKALRECEGKLSIQENLTFAVQDEVVTVRREFPISHRESKVLSAENARLASAVSLDAAKNLRLASTVKGEV